MFSLISIVNLNENVPKPVPGSGDQIGNFENKCRAITDRNLKLIKKGDLIIYVFNSQLGT